MKKIVYVDFDGTLAKYDGWKGAEVTGDPVPLMVERVKNLLKEDKHVVIFTARLTPAIEFGFREETIDNIENWCLEHIGQRLPVTNIKGSFADLYDDRCFRIIRNTGLTTEEIISSIIADELASPERTKEDSLARIMDAIENIRKENND